MRCAFLFLFFPYLMLQSCSTPNGVATKVSTPEKLAINFPPNTDDKICFLTLQITVNDSVKQDYRVTVVKTQFAAGRLKTAGSDDEETEIGYLYCEFLNGDKKRIRFIKVENPLARTVEFNSSPSAPLEKRTIRSKSGEFVLRFQADNNIKYLFVYLPNESTKTLKRIYYASM